MAQVVDLKTWNQKKILTGIITYTDTAFYWKLESTGTVKSNKNKMYQNDRWLWLLVNAGVAFIWTVDPL